MKLLLENWRKYLNEDEDLLDPDYDDEWDKFTDNLRLNAPDIYNSGLIEAAIKYARDSGAKYDYFYLVVLKFIEQKNKEALEIGRRGTNFPLDLNSWFLEIKASNSKENKNTTKEIRILSPFYQPSSFNGRPFVVVETPSYGNVGFYRSSGRGTGEFSKGKWLPFGGVSLKDGDTWLVKMAEDHNEADLDDEYNGKFWKSGGEFETVSEYLKENFSNPVTKLNYNFILQRKELETGEIMTDPENEDMIGPYENCTINFLLEDHGAIQEDWYRRITNGKFWGLSDIVKTEVLPPARFGKVIFLKVERNK